MSPPREVHGEGERATLPRRDVAGVISHSSPPVLHTTEILICVSIKKAGSFRAHMPRADMRNRGIDVQHHPRIPSDEYGVCLSSRQQPQKRYNNRGTCAGGWGLPRKSQAAGCCCDPGCCCLHARVLLVSCVFCCDYDRHACLCYPGCADRIARLDTCPASDHRDSNWSIDWLGNTTIKTAIVREATSETTGSSMMKCSFSRRQTNQSAAGSRHHQQVYQMSFT